MMVVSRDPDFVTPEDPLNDPRAMRVLVCCLMRALGERKHIFRQEDFDRVKSNAMQCEYADEGLVLYRADSVDELPEMS